MNYKMIAQDYRRDGFAIAGNLFPPGELRTLEEQWRCYLEEVLPVAMPGEVYYEDVPPRTVRCVFGMHKRSEYFRRLAQDPRLIRLVETIFGGGEAIADQVMLINKAPYASYEFPYHQDNAYQFWDPPDAVAATLALDESTPDNGAIVCLKGSHEMGVLPHCPSGVLGASLGLVEAPDTGTFPEVTLCLKPGDLAVHHVNVIHATGPNRTGRQRRNLGFAYHSSRARRDPQAYARYQEHMRRINLTSSAIG